MSSSNTGVGPNRGDPDDVGQRGYQEPPAPVQEPRHTRWQTRARSPVLAGVLSLCPGLGQIYVGHYQRGFINLAVIAMTIAFLAWAKPVPLDIIGGFFVAFYWLYNIVDAMRLANFYNAALAGTPGADLAEPAVLPGRGGSLLGGITLLGVGFLLILHTVFDLSLEWLEDWWPMIPILFGIYLIVRGIQERKD